MIFFLTGILDSVGEYLTDHFGRKPIYIIVVFIQIISYLIAIFIKSYWINTLANGLMVSGVALNFALLLVFTSESFPTSIRNKA